MHVYNWLPVWAQTVAISAYGLKLERLRYGGVHSRVLGELRQSQWLSAEQVRERSEEALTRAVHAAMQDVPWYAAQRRTLPARLGISDLSALPILQKEQVRASPEAFVSARFDRRELHSVFTGGTTGTPLEILATRETLQSNFAFFMRFREWAGVPARARVATFAGRTIVPVDDGAPYSRRNLARNAWLFSSYHLSDATLDTYCDELAAVAPQLIDAYPSSIEPLARHLVGSGRSDIRPTAVITSSETLYPEVRHLVERAMHCRVFDHYGAAEMAAFVTQCEHQRYHVNPEFGVVEIVRDGEIVPHGESGELVATGFINPAMPLLRYATGDLAAFSAEQACPCGRHFPVLEQIEGRIDDVIVTPEGRRIGRIDPIFKGIDGVYEARVIQDRPAHVVFEYVPVDGFHAERLQPVLDALRARIGVSMEIESRAVARIERTSGGKRRMVVNQLREPR